MSNKLYQSVTDKWGTDAQLTVAIEELSELIKEICKYKRGIGRMSHMAEEVADVEIMLEQLKFIFGFSDEVERWKTDKLMRLSVLIGKDENESE